MMKKNIDQLCRTPKQSIYLVLLIGFLLLPFTSVFGQTINICVGQTFNLPACAGPSTAYLYSGNPAATLDNSALTLTGNFPASGLSISCTSGSTVIVTFTVNIIALPAPSVVSTTAACNGANDGTATLTGGGSYNWSNGIGIQPATATGLAPGTYTVTVTDSSTGCSAPPLTVIITEAASPLTSSITEDNGACKGASDGEATVTAAGGSPPYTYSWSSGGTAATETGLAAGNYTVTVSDANGCTSEATVTITESSTVELTASAAEDESACTGASDGEATVTAAGGSAPYTYSWSSGGTAATETGLAAGNYTVSVTDANGCTSEAMVTITESGPAIDTQPTAQTECVGDDAEFTAAASGTGLTFQWQSDCSGNFADIAGETAATLSLTGVATTDACNYQLVVTDTNGCMVTSDIVSLTVNAPNIDTQPMSQDLCFGDDATFSVAASGGAAPLTYQWQSDCSGSFMNIAGETAASLSITNISSGDRCDYQVIITDANGCELTSDVATLDASSPTSVTTQPMPTTACAGDDASFTIVMRSTTVTFQWQSDCSGTFMDIAGATSATYTITAAQAANACNYQVVVTNANDCITISDAVALDIIALPEPPDATTSNFNICESEAIPDFEVAATTVVAPATTCTTNWFDAPTGGTMVGTGEIFNSNGQIGEEGTTVDTNTPGTYTFYAEANCDDCTSNSRTQITLVIEASADPVCVAQDITITLDGTGNFTITPEDIDNGSTVGCAGTLNLSLDQTSFNCDNVLTTNTVTLTVDDGNGNSSTCTATVTVLPDATCTDPSFDCPATQVSCTGDPFNLNPAESGGTYSGTAASFVMNDVLDPTGMSPGSYTLTYTIDGFVSELCEFIVVRPMKSANAGSLRN